MGTEAGIASDIRSILAQSKKARNRLRNPTNPVPDTEIDLKRRKLAALIPEPLYQSPLLQKEVEIDIEPPPPKQIEPCLTRQLISSRIVKITAQYFGVSTSDIMSRSKQAAYVMPRQMACYVLREVTKRSMPVIGHILGGRDHTTVLYAYRKIEGRIKTDPVVGAHFSNIMALIDADIANFRPSVPAQPQPVMALKLENQKSLPQPEIHVLDKASGTALVDIKTAKFSNYFWSIFGGDHPVPARQEASGYRQSYQGAAGFLTKFYDYRERQILAWSSTSVGSSLRSATWSSCDHF